MKMKILVLLLLIGCKQITVPIPSTTPLPSQTTTPSIPSKILSRPWVGHKNVLVLRGRNVEAAQNGQEDILLKNLYSLGRMFTKTSNNRVSLSFNVEEVLIPQGVPCVAHDMIKAFSKAHPFDKDFTVITMHEQMVNSFTPICTGLSGYAKNTIPGCPECTPSIYVPRLAFNHPDTVFPHEFGHGLGLNHPEINYFCPNGDHFNSSCKRFVAPQDTMGLGGIQFFNYSAIDRLALGWLTEAQVITATKPGVYEIYSDNDDRSSDPTKPLILQVPHKGDFIYVTVPNIKSSDEDYSKVNLNEARKFGALYASGIQISTMIGNSIQLYHSAENHIDSQDSIYKSPIQAGGQFVTNGIVIKHISRTGNHATVEIK